MSSTLDAIILGGGVAKGAFAAGVLAELGKAGLNVRRIVGTSSGALNAAFYARAVRSGTETSAGEELARIWLDEGTLGHGFNVSPKGLFELEGVSTSQPLIELLRRHVRPSTGQHPIDVRLVTTNATGEPGELEPGRSGTTYEHVLRYDGTTFDAQAGLEELFRGVAASAAFPGAYVPVPLSINGRVLPCLDGGLTNNTAVKYAIEGEPSVDRVFVIVPYPARLETPVADMHGAALASHLVDILVQERLYRDLREAYATNATLTRLQERLPPAVLAGVLHALQWSDRRRLEIVEMRPARELRGDAFDGLLSRSLRGEYVDAGRSVGRTWIEAANGEISRGAPAERAV